MANSAEGSKLYSPSANQETDSFYDTIGDTMTSPEYDNAVNNSLPGTPVDPEERQRQEEEWKEELAKLEDEISTLRQVLSNKVRAAGDLKRKLGITPMVELKHDLRQGLSNIKESDAYQKTSETLYTVSEKVTATNAYQKTNQTLKNVGQKTTSAFTTIGSFTSRKFGDMRNSTAFKSFEEKVGGAVSNVKSYVRPKSTGDLAEESERLTDSGFSSPAAEGTTTAAAAPTTKPAAPAPEANTPAEKK